MLSRVAGPQMLCPNTANYWKFALWMINKATLLLTGFTRVSWCEEILQCIFSNSLVGWNLFKWSSAIAVVLLDHRQGEWWVVIVKYDFCTSKHMGGDELPVGKAAGKSFVCNQWTDTAAVSPRSIVLHQFWPRKHNLSYYTASRCRLLTWFSVCIVTVDNWPLVSDW